MAAATHAARDNRRPRWLEPPGSSAFRRSIREARALFEECDRASLPADQALQACGPQSHVQACATNTVKRLFTLENGRSGGPREHVIRSILHQHLLRRVNTLQCVAEHGVSASEPQLEAFRSSPPAPEKAAANR